jgi:hypothetical protein
VMDSKHELECAKGGGDLSQPHFGQVWGEAQHLEKLGIWSPPGHPNV